MLYGVAQGGDGAMVRRGEATADVGGAGPSPYLALALAAATTASADVAGPAGEAAVAAAHPPSPALAAATTAQADAAGPAGAAVAAALHSCQQALPLHRIEEL